MNNDLEIRNSEELERIAGLTAHQNRILRFNQAVWALWWAGAILVALSWVSVVSNVVGWIGFAATLASSFASVVVGRYWKFPR